MKVKIRLFALFRELVGKRELELEVEVGTTLKDLRKALKETFPQLRNYELMAAVNGQYQESGFELKEGDEVALLPPFSGGQGDRAQR